MIDLDDIHYRFPDGAVALRGISARAEAAERIVLLGANGSGKTTLLKILAALLFPTAGRYEFRGRRITPGVMRGGDFPRSFRREVAYLFQNPDAMIFNPTVRDEIAFGLRQLGVPEIPQRVERWAAHSSGACAFPWRPGLTSRPFRPSSTSPRCSACWSTARWRSWPGSRLNGCSP